METPPPSTAILVIPWLLSFLSAKGKHKCNGLSTTLPIYELLNDDKSDDKGNDKSIRVGNGGSRGSTQYCPPHTWPTNGRVEYRDITLQYPSAAQPALREISFVVPSKMKVGVVGRA